MPSLVDLPVEILHLIYQAIDNPYERACYSLTSQKLFTIFGPGACEATKLASTELKGNAKVVTEPVFFRRMEFLCLLLRDMGPEFYISSLALMKISKANRAAVQGLTPGYSETTTKGEQPQAEFVTRFYRDIPRCSFLSMLSIWQPFKSFGYHLSIDHVRLAYIRHKSGPEYGIPLSALAHRELNVQQPVTMISVEPRVSASGESLLLRVQHMIHCQGDLDVAHLVQTHRPLWRCCGASVWGLGILERLFSRAMKGGKDVKSKIMEPGQCRYCGQDFSARISAEARSQVVFVVTRWLDIGSGDPRELSWGIAHGRIRETMATPRKSFESAPGGLYERSWTASNLKSFRASIDQVPGIFGGDLLSRVSNYRLGKVVEVEGGIRWVNKGKGHWICDDGEEEGGALPRHIHGPEVQENAELLAKR